MSERCALCLWHALKPRLNRRSQHPKLLNRKPDALVARQRRTLNILWPAARFGPLNTCKCRSGLPDDRAWSVRPSETVAQRAQYPLIQEYTLNHSIKAL